MLSDKISENILVTQNAAQSVLDILHKGLTMENARAIAGSVHTMNESLTVLASLEGEKVFPLLQSSSERDVKLYSEKCAREISRLTSKINAYAATYADAETIYAAQHNFPPVTDFLIESLLNHLDRQKNEFLSILQKTDAQFIL
jgi:hypothetical protein